jgi:hypothetical protein
MSSTINTAWNAVTVILLENFTFNVIKSVVGLAGLDKSKIAHLNYPDVQKGRLIGEIDNEVSQFSEYKKEHFLNIVIEEIIERNPLLKDRLEKYLSRLGWKLIDGSVIPIDIFDLSDLPELHEKASEDFLKAAQRFRDGDLSGSLSSACAAVDSVTSAIYEEKGLGDAHKASFQERCKVAISSVGMLDDVKNELDNIEWKESGVFPFCKNLEGSLNQAAFVMQTLRANMSDVHGTKPVLRPLVFDSIKWAEILVRVMSKK